MQSSSVATLKASLPLYIHLSEDGGSVEYAIDDMPVATMSCAGTDAPSSFELGCRKLRQRLESELDFTDKDWEECFDIPRKVENREVIF